MRKKHRIILILVVGALVGSLVIAVSLPGREENPYLINAWDKASWAFHDVMVNLGLRRPRYNGNHRISNLKQIDGAKGCWALENKKTNTDIPTATDLYSAAAYIRDRPTCPQSGKYVIGSVQQKPRCSIPGHPL